MAQQFIGSGLIFPRAIYPAGSHTSDDIFIGDQIVPMGIHFDTDVDLIAHIDIYIGDELHEDWLVEAVQVVDCPYSLQIHYVVRRFKIRLELTAPTNLICELSTKKAG